MRMRSPMGPSSGMPLMTPPDRTSNPHFRTTRPLCRASPPTRSSIGPGQPLSCVSGRGQFLGCVSGRGAAVVVEGFGRGAVAEAGVQTDPVVEVLDVVGDGEPGAGPG